MLCLASYEKGYDFLREAKRAGWRVLLLTSESLKDKHAFPREALDDIFYMPDVHKKWDRQQTLNAVSHLFRQVRLDRIVPLDDFDLENAAALREHLRVPGMGETTTRYFRDKLAMRMRATDAGIAVPEFIGVLHHPAMDEFCRRTPTPWLLKPRFQAGAVGIKKVSTAEEMWNIVNTLGDEQSNYILERYIPGDIYHVDSITFGKKVLFSIASRYGAPPMDVAHDGGIFTTTTLQQTSPIARALLAANKKVLAAMGMVRGVTHTEFIRSSAGKIYFLETAARVGGAHIVELVEAASGINLWAEWAKTEIAGEDGKYSPPRPRTDFAGLLVSLARQEWPDTSSFNDDEIVWRMTGKSHHVGFIVRSPKLHRVHTLLAGYTARVQNEFHASAPSPDRPVD